MRKESSPTVSSPALGFEILIDDGLAKLVNDSAMSPVHNKTVLSIANDFEEKDWRHEKFRNFIWNNIANTALSAGERNNLADERATTLVEAAKRLRLTDSDSADKGKGSEIAEIVLYGIMQRHYGALPVVPKIFYKQNSQDYAKGADSVHIVVTNNNDFSLWFGEAKFYKNIEDADLDNVVKSVEDSLRPDKLKKENSIITNVNDLNELIKDSNLNAEIRKILSGGTSLDNIKPKLHIPILLLHECPLTKKQEEMTDVYREKLRAYHKARAESYFKKQIKKCSSINKYSAISFHIILFPVPDKASIVKDFIAQASLYRPQNGKPKKR